MNKFYIILIVSFLWIIGCSSPSIKDFSGSELDYQFALTDSGDFYFPINTNPTSRNVENNLDSFYNKWYSKHLYSLKEPIIYNEKKVMEVYRYTNLGTWERPYSFRIVKTDSIISITRKLTDGQGGYEAGKLIINQTKIIPILEWNNFKKNINNFRFWHEPTHIDYFGFDGAQWILEGYKNGEYHFLNRWSPDRNDESQFMKVCNSFEELFEGINSETDTE